METQMNQGDFDRSAIELVDAVREVFEREAARNSAAAPQLERALALMAELQPDPERPEAGTVSGCRHLERVLDLADAGPAAPVAKALRKLLPELHWAQNPRYNAENRGTDFMENYGWSALGLTGSSDIAFGVLLLGPGVTYPPTSYESEGIFLVIGGSPEWKSGDEPWRRVSAGDVICRPWSGSEGKRPGEEPMLALYAWMYRQP